VGRGHHVLILLAGEDIHGSEVTLCVTVLAGLGGGHIHNLMQQDRSTMAENCQEDYPQHNPYQPCVDAA
jgi:hypothetical protein